MKYNDLSHITSSQISRRPKIEVCSSHIHVQQVPVRNIVTIQLKVDYKELLQRIWDTFG